jgi:hypothetical protein
VSHVGYREDTRVAKHRPMKRVRITGPDLKHAKSILKEHFPKTAEKTAANIEKQEREQREGEWVRYQNEMRLRVSQEHAASAVSFMNKRLKRGAPSTRPSFQMPGYFKSFPDGSRRLVRVGDPDY